MADLYIFACSNCRALNVFAKSDVDNVILRCYHCDNLQVIPKDATTITEDRYNEIKQYESFGDGIGEGQDFNN